MIEIRPAQWQKLGQQSFEDEMLRHLSGYAPELARVMTPPRLQQLVRLGVERGKQYGLSKRGPLRLYLETMLALGSGFDTDPLLMRATAALREPAMEQAARADALHAAVSEYLDQVHGPGDRHALAALERARDLPYDALAGSGSLGQRALALFHGGFPQKSAYAGEPAVRQLLSGAASVSEEFGVQSDAGRLLVACLQYGLGHEVFSDPAYAWTAATLRNPSIPVDDRPQHLHRKMRLYLTATLEHLAAR